MNAQLPRRPLPYVAVATGEGVVFRVPLGGVSSRFLAWLVDLAVMLALVAIATRVTQIFTFAADLQQSLQILLAFVIFTGYGFACEWRLRGQTLGKRLMRLRVVDSEGRKLSFSQVVLRNLLRFADMLPVAYAVGGLSLVLTKRCQRLGDLAAGTLVVRTDVVELPDLGGLLGDEYNSLGQHPVLMARLRKALSPGALDAALMAVLRRDKLSPEHRVQVFSDIASHFRNLVSLPEALTLGMSDERLVVNVVRLMYDRDPVRLPGHRL